MNDRDKSPPRVFDVVLSSIARLAPYPFVASLVLTGVITLALVTGLLDLVFPDLAGRTYLGVALLAFGASAVGGVSYACSSALMCSVLTDTEVGPGEEGMVAYLKVVGLFTCIGAYVVGLVTVAVFILVNTGLA